MKKKELINYLKSGIASKEKQIEMLKPMADNPTVYTMYVKDKGYLEALKDTLDLVQGNAISFKIATMID